MATQETILANMASLGFDNPSEVAIFNKIAEAFALTVDVTLTEIKNSENRIFNIINMQRYGKDGYYTKVARAFQLGDNLIEDSATNDFVYEVIDSTKQIVSQAAFAEIKSANSSQLFLKIAMLNKTTGLLEPLPIPSYNAFVNYFRNFEVPGLPVSIVNTPGNILLFSAKATYYATYDFPTLQNNVIAALSAFRNSFDFNGTFYDGDLEQFVKTTVPGIRDFYLYNSTIDSIPFTGSISLNSGYFNYVADIQNNITYIPI